MTSRELKSWYDEINRDFYRGRLPDIIVRFAPITVHRDGTRMARGLIEGRTYFEKRAGRHERYHAVEIRISPWCGASPRRRYAWMTLVHETVHVDLGYRPDCRVSSGFFAKRLRQLTRRGILDCAV